MFLWNLQIHFNRRESTVSTLLQNQSAVSKSGVVGRGFKVSFFL